jgi:hypothetical protein
MVAFDNGIPEGGVLKIDHDTVTNCEPTACSIATMGNSLDGTGDGSTKVESMSTDSDSGVTSCVLNDDVDALTPVRVTLSCSGV